MLRLAPLCLMLALVAGCRSENFTEIESPRAPLIGGFESYATREEVLPKLPSGIDVKVVADSSLAKSDSQPPYKLHTLSLSPYEHLKQRGKLQLTFYNNRLEQCMFYPDNLDDYIRALDQSGIRLGMRREVNQGNTVIWQGRDADQIEYIGWADKRLRDQQRRWLARYD